MKKIVLMPIKNEDWILNFSLSQISKWADYIIIADQNSIDRSIEICKRFKKVSIIKNEESWT
jgi:ribosomal silencing factor RsfS